QDEASHSLLAFSLSSIARIGICRLRWSRKEGSSGVFAVKESISRSPQDVEKAGDGSKTTHKAIAKEVEANDARRRQVGCSTEHKRGGGRLRPGMGSESRSPDSRLRRRLSPRFDLG